eukprot:gene3728-biopygen9799
MFSVHLTETSVQGMFRVHLTETSVGPRAGHVQSGMFRVHLTETSVGPRAGHVQSSSDRNFRGSPGRACSVSQSGFVRNRSGPDNSERKQSSGRTIVRVAIVPPISFADLGGGRTIVRSNNRSGVNRSPPISFVDWGGGRTIVRRTIVRPPKCSPAGSSGIVRANNRPGTESFALDIVRCSP